MRAIRDLMGMRSPKAQDVSLTDIASVTQEPSGGMVAATSDGKLHRVHSQATSPRSSGNDRAPGAMTPKSSGGKDRVRSPPGGMAATSSGGKDRVRSPSVATSPTSSSSKDRVCSSPFDSVEPGGGGVERRGSGRGATATCRSPEPQKPRLSAGIFASDPVRRVQPTRSAGDSESSGGAQGEACRKTISAFARPSSSAAQSSGASREWVPTPPAAAPPSEAQRFRRRALEPGNPKAAVTVDVLPPMSAFRHSDAQFVTSTADSLPRMPLDSVEASLHHITSKERSIRRGRGPAIVRRGWEHSGEATSASRMESSQVTSPSLAPSTSSAVPFLGMLGLRKPQNEQQTRPKTMEDVQRIVDNQAMGPFAW